MVLYDRVLKRTPLGPLGMGACRVLNVLLGMSAAPIEWHVVHWLVAAGIGTYIVGVTWFARTEATLSKRGQLALATATMLCGMALLAWFPWWADAETPPASQPNYALVDPNRWLMVWGVMGFLVVRRCLLAVWEPVPARVQTAVTNCIFSLIVLDAICCFAVHGLPWAAAILLLLIPTMFLGRWIYAT